MYPDYLYGSRRYQYFGSTGLKVSPLSLGSLNFCNDNIKESKTIVDYYLANGGNFIDTANNYGGGKTEEILGHILPLKNRDNFILSTKFTAALDDQDPNNFGSHRKNMVLSVEKSLKNLRVDYIDILWVHLWDHATSTYEMMSGLRDLVSQGKVLYLGASNMPSWKVIEANMLSSFNGWVPFSALQMHYNLFDRSLEPEYIPMIREHKLAIQPWSPMAGGMLCKNNLAAASSEISNFRYNFNKEMYSNEDRNQEITNAVSIVAKELDKSVAQIALGYIIQKESIISPVIGCRNVNQLKESLEVLDFDIPKDLVCLLDEVSSPMKAFPYSYYSLPFIKKYLPQ
ncbi:MAG: aldo/keto reductase [Alphaproteobacteria bacterium]|nr:aldo/keto reductase [Alphaproteobacteria bacterium]